jgi:hypothetical protein
MSLAGSRFVLLCLVFLFVPWFYNPGGGVRAPNAQDTPESPTYPD